MKNVCYMRSPVGLLGIAEENGQVTDLFFGYDKASIGTLETETPVLLRARSSSWNILTAHAGNLTYPWIPTERLFSFPSGRPC